MQTCFAKKKNYRKTEKNHSWKKTCNKKNLPTTTSEKTHTREKKNSVFQNDLEPSDKMCLQKKNKWKKENITDNHEQQEQKILLKSKKNNNFVAMLRSSPKKVWKKNSRRTTTNPKDWKSCWFLIKTHARTYILKFALKNSWYIRIIWIWIYLRFLYFHFHFFLLAFGWYVCVCLNFSTLLVSNRHIEHLFFFLLFRGILFLNKKTTCKTQDIILCVFVSWTTTCIHDVFWVVRSHSLIYTQLARVCVWWYITPSPKLTYIYLCESVQV